MNLNIKKMENNELTTWTAPELTIQSWTETEDVLGFFMTPVHS